MNTRIRPPRTRQYHRLAVAALVTAALSLAGAAPAMAYAPVKVVHTERVQVGPYGVTVGFSVWPIRAMRSLDFTFLPDGGIVGKVREAAPERARHQTRRARHAPRAPTRKLDSWGLDVKALNAPGACSFGFAIDGPFGHGDGTLQGVTVLNQPGPPLGRAGPSARCRSSVWSSSSWSPCGVSGPAASPSRSRSTQQRR